MFIANPRYWVLLKLKLVSLGPNWKENICLRNQNIIAPLNGIDGSKAVDNTLLEVSAKVGETKRKKSLNFFNATGFDCDQELGKPHKKMSGSKQGEVCHHCGYQV